MNLLVTYMNPHPVDFKDLKEGDCFQGTTTLGESIILTSILPQEFVNFIALPTTFIIHRSIESLSNFIIHSSVDKIVLSEILLAR